MRLFILFLFLLPLFSNSYICLIHPKQRGRLSIGKFADPACNQQKPFCGVIPPEEPKYILYGGETIEILFQQNLNHYNPQKPGFMDVSFAFTPNPTREEEFYTWQGAVVPDINRQAIVQTNFTVVGIVPNVTCEHAIIRVRYVSNQVSPFYQCTDVKIIPKP